MFSASVRFNRGLRTSNIPVIHRACIFSQWLRYNNQVHHFESLRIAKGRISPIDEIIQPLGTGRRHNKRILAPEKCRLWGKVGCVCVPDAVRARGRAWGRCKGPTVKGKEHPKIPHPAGLCKPHAMLELRLPQERNSWVSEKTQYKLFF